MLSRYHLITVSCLTFLTVPLTFGAEPADTNYDEAKVPEYTLPTLFPVGTKPDTARKIWESSRRAEVLGLLEQHVYGVTPNAPVKITSMVVEQSDDALDGLARRRQITLSISPVAHPDRSLKIEVLIYSPVKPGGPAPAFIGLNFRGNHTVHPDPAIRVLQENPRGLYKERWQLETLLKRGYGLVTAYCGDIDPDNYKHDFSDGAHPLFYKGGQTVPADDGWGTIGAWAWGLSQIRESLATSKLIDAERLAVIGHSRLGKTALWAGAQDEKFAMVISNNSGSGGAALYRRCYGERIHHMLKPVGYWFCRNHATYAKRESELPVDQHMLMALVAPRPLYVASAAEDRWADPKGEFLSAKHASPVYELFVKKGVPGNEMPEVDKPIAGRIGYHIRSGKHDVTMFDWKQYLDFADKHL